MVLDRIRQRPTQLPSKYPSLATQPAPTLCFLRYLARQSHGSWSMLRCTPKSVAAVSCSTLQITRSHASMVRSGPIWQDGSAWWVRDPLRTRKLWTILWRLASSPKLLNSWHLESISPSIRANLLSVGAWMLSVEVLALVIGSLTVWATGWLSIGN